MIMIILYIFQMQLNLKTEINVALKKDKRTMKFMLKKLLNEKFNPDIFYLLANINPKLINDKIIRKS